ncbi:MAG: hypothetical protein FWC49_05090 [Proteobacteria bacterium]|nr:hypothetical protein [Pseudomonadota bacterium]
MHIAGVHFSLPTPGKIFWMLSACLIVTVSLYGVGALIDEGSIKNQPEVLRHCMFWPFSLVLAFRIAYAFGLSENTLSKKVLMIFMFFIPAAFVQSFVVGIL